MRIFLLCVCFLIHTNVYAQTTIKGLPTSLTVSSYIEAYYSNDFTGLAGRTKPDFLVSFSKNDLPSVNLALIKGSYTGNHIRANLGIAGGTYMNANYKAEPGLLKHFYEGNVGFRLSKEKEIWLDVGVFPSHIGFESAVGKENWVLTRAFGAENTPYFESGAKLSVTSDNKKWHASVLVLSGWQRIKPVTGNTLPSFGTQIVYKPSSNLTLNSSTFFGSDKSDESRQMRYFHNFYGIYKLNDLFSTILGFDIGLEQKAKNSSAMNLWFNPIGILRYTPSEKIGIAIKGEYYHDKHHVIISYGEPYAFKTYGFSINFDYHFTNHLLWRIEGRTLQSDNPIFARQDGTASKSNSFITSSIAISF